MSPSLPVAISFNRGLDWIHEFKVVLFICMQVHLRYLEVLILLHDPFERNSPTRLIIHLESLINFPQLFEGQLERNQADVLADDLEYFVL